MGEKKNNNNDGGDKNNKKKGDGENKKEEKKPITVVLKIDMDCEGCASKIVKCARSLDGVETVKADMDANKLTVIGNVDPSKIREKLHHKLKKKVDLISPQPKKEDNNNKNDNKDSKQDKKPDEKKPKEKEAPVTTAVLKLSFHCQGCIIKIHEAIKKTKGVHEHSLDKQKDLVTVKGTMDVKALVETLRERLKRDVEVVPPKKEKDGGGDNNGGGGGKKKKGGGDGGGQEGESGGGKVEGNKMEYVMQPGYDLGYGYPIGYPTGYEYPVQYPVQYPAQYPVQYPVQYHAPQMFSDENPNACTIM